MKRKLLGLSLALVFSRSRTRERTRPRGKRGKSDEGNPQRPRQYSAERSGQSGLRGDFAFGLLASEKKNQQVEQERHELQQFVYPLREQGAAAPKESPPKNRRPTGTPGGRRLK